MKNSLSNLILCFFLLSIYLSVENLFSQSLIENYFKNPVRISHDLNYSNLIHTPPFINNYNFNNFYTNSVYPNINISNNLFPQNEPTVCISRINPDIVVAAWRDFRTGINPPLRRIGYSVSNNGGITWSASTLVPSHSSYYTLASDPALCTDTAGNFYLATITISIDYRGIVVVYKSTDQGITFDTGTNAAPHLDTNYHLDDKEYIICDLGSESPYKNNLYIVWAGYNGSCFVKSTNSGINWSERKLFSNESMVFSDLATGPQGDLYIFSNGVVFSNGAWGMYINRTTDGGENFSSCILVDSLPDNFDLIRIPSIAADNSNGSRRGYVYAVWSRPYNYAVTNADEDIFFAYSSDRGENWSIPKRVNDDEPQNGKRQKWPWISVDDSGIISIIYYDSRNTQSVNLIEAWHAKSTDGGLNFTNEVLSTMVSISEYTDPNIRYGDYINIDSYGGKIIPVWTDQRFPGANMEIYTAILGDTVIGINDPVTEIPKEFRISQNYPNPFNPETNIKFEVPKISEVKITIYDLLGNEIAIIANKIYNPGIYLVKWNGENYSSGVYFYRFKSDVYTETKKMILLK